MSRYETPLTREYWATVGGTLIEEFVAVPRSTTSGVRRLDGVIVLGGERRIEPAGERASLDGEDVICVQTKATVLSATLVGQAIFSPRLILQRHKPRSLRSVAIYPRVDQALRPFLDEFGVESWVVEPAGHRGSRDDYPPRPELIDELWAAVGGSIVRNVALVERRRGQPRHVCEAVILPDGAHRQLDAVPDLRDRDVLGVVTVRRRPGMYATGKALVAQGLLHRLGARRVRTVILAKEHDEAIEGALAEFADISVHDPPFETGALSDQSRIDRVEGPTPAGGAYAEAIRDRYGRVREIVENDQTAR